MRQLHEFAARGRKRVSFLFTLIAICLMSSLEFSFDWEFSKIKDEEKQKVNLNEMQWNFSNLDRSDVSKVKLRKPIFLPQRINTAYTQLADSMMQFNLNND